MSAVVVIQDAWDAAQYLLDQEVRPAHDIEIVIASVVDHPRAWAFSYQSRPFLEAADITGSLVGNGPVVVPKAGGQPFFAAPGETLDDQLSRL